MEYGKLLQRFWWVVIVLFVCIAYYFHLIRPKEVQILSLRYREIELLKEKEALLSEKRELLLRIQSHNDPAWIEMVLMKELGVVPEGYVKIHFQKQPDVSTRKKR